MPHGVSVRVELVNVIDDVPPTFKDVEMKAPLWHGFAVLRDHAVSVLQAD
jgi:hypothetical protein